MPQAQSATTAAQIKQLAAQMGFDVVGITRPQDLVEGERAIEAWVGEGRHGSMQYLEDYKKRRDRFYSGVAELKSVLVLGVNYYSPSANETPQHLAGRVARYAWGKDYHQVIRQKHEALIEALQKSIGLSFQARSCVDIQPLPERFAAVQSGLGFIGKNTMLLSQKYGPWLFLSEIITNLELEEDAPFEGDCGTCAKCQKVCPTGALDEDYRIDARLCIAYLTIEHKGVIPRELRPKIKGWVFGCDECLTVCPFTSKSKETRWPEFRPESGTGEWLVLEQLFEIGSNSMHERTFENTALLRANRKQLLRNACIVLGNSGKREAIPLLVKAMSDQAALVRLHAAWALGQLPFDEAKTVLKRFQRTEIDAQVSAEISVAIKTESVSEAT